MSERATVRTVVVHVGSNDVGKQQSKGLKKGFTELLRTVHSLEADVFIGGPIPLVI